MANGFRKKVSKPAKRPRLAGAGPSGADPGSLARLGELSDLKADPRNANAGTDRGRELLKASMQKFGAARSIVVDRRGVIIGGNKTQAAALAAGLAGVIVVPSDGSRLVVVQRTDLDLETDPKAAALGVADNRAGEVGLAWDQDVLLELAGRGVSLEEMWTEGELSELLERPDKSGLTDPDAVPVERRTSIKPGQMFALGRHRLLCGDSTDPDTVTRVLQGAAIRLMVTDPPYGVDYDPEWRTRAGVSKSKRVGKVTNDDRADWGPVWELFPGDVSYVWHGGMSGAEVHASLTNAGFDVRAQIIWRKPRIVLSRGHYHWQHEPCFYAVRRGRTAHWTGKRNQSTVWTVSPTIHRCGSCGSVEIESAPDEFPTTVWDIQQHDQTGDTTHGTQKPVECMARPMRNHVAPTVFEPFSGSGTTIIAAEMLSRACHAIELEPKYVQQAIDRWQAFTGLKAVAVG